MASLNGLGLRQGVDSRSDSTEEGERRKYGLFEKVCYEFLRRRISCL